MTDSLSHAKRRPTLSWSLFKDSRRTAQCGPWTFVVSLDFILADPNFWHLSIHNRTYAVENGKRIFSDRILSAVYNEAARVAGDLGDFMGLGPDET